MLSFSISYWDLIKFPSYTTERGGDRGERQGEDRVGEFMDKSNIWFHLGNSFLGEEAGPIYR
jgi:hypothetical protein